MIISLFFLNNGKILRTQTTPFQRLAFHSNILKSFVIGRTFRKDSDATHTPMFHQMDILIMDCNLHQLLQFLKDFLSLFFQKDVEMRLRSSYFPFTNPSIEIDIFWQNKWLEILGCGIVHENVMANAKKDFKVCGAAGLGIERLAMIKYGIDDIRWFYNGLPQTTEKIGKI